MKKILAGILVLVVFSFFLATEVDAQQTATLNPVTTNFVDSHFSEMNTDDFKGLSVLRKYPDEQDDRWIIFRFDTSSIPSNAVVHSATLRFYQLDVSRGRLSVDMRIVKITSPWVPSTVTWNNRPSYSTDQTSSVAAVNQNAGYKEWQVTSLAADWISNKDLNYGGYIQVLDFEDGYWLSHFRCHESENPPQLIVNYSLPARQLPSSDQLIKPPAGLMEADLSSPVSSPTPTAAPAANPTETPADFDTSFDRYDPFYDDYNYTPELQAQQVQQVRTTQATDSSEIESKELDAESNRDDFADGEGLNPDTVSVAGVFLDPDSFVGRLAVSARQNSRSLKLALYGLLVLMGVAVGILAAKEIRDNKKKGISFKKSIKRDWEEMVAFFAALFSRKKKVPPAETE